MDEQFVQGVVGGVLKRHENRTLDKNRIQTLMVEIAANIELVSSVKGKVYETEKLSKEYLDYWTCNICDEHTHEVDYDYLGNGTNHLGCELKQEELQKKSDKIMKRVEEDMKDYDLSKSESNENSIVDMSATTRRGK
jgi:hypothetical protein|tara:strand:- start:44 stop:454 length:411 start_codon:yes stop_codon:yes gene_type:complete